MSSKKKKGMALILHPHLSSGRIEDEPHRDPLAFSGLAPEQRAFLRCYIETLKITEALKKAHVTLWAHHAWLERSAVYREQWEFAKETRRILRNEFAEDKAIRGVTEKTFDGRGNLIAFRVKDDPGLIKALMAKEDPEGWGEPDRSTTAIQVNVIFKDE